MAVMSINHPLAYKDVLSSEDLHKCSFISQRNTYFAQLADPTLPPPRFTSVRQSFIIHLLNNSDSILICPSNDASHTLESDLAKDLVIRRLEPEPKVDVEILTLKTKKDSPLVQAFLRHVESSEEVLNKPILYNQ